MTWSLLLATSNPRLIAWGLMSGAFIFGALVVYGAMSFYRYRYLRRQADIYAKGMITELNITVAELNRQLVKKSSVIRNLRAQNRAMHAVLTNWEAVEDEEGAAD